MNEHSLNDPELKSLEAHLAALTPQLPVGEQQELLYRAAFASGQREVERKLRRWQLSAATLVVLCLGLSIPQVQNRFSSNRPDSKPFVPTDVAHDRLVDQQNLAPRPRQAVTVSLDAWQTGPSSSALVSAEGSRFDQLEPNLRALSVSTLTRAALQP